MRPAADSDPQKQQVGEAQMRVIPYNKQPPCNKEPAAGDSPKLGGFWHRLAAAIDSLAAYPVKHALSERQLRQVDHEMTRCRQLILTRPRRHMLAIARRTPAPHALAALEVRS
jgi:hypothetical protein